VNEAHIFLDPDEDSGYYIEETIPGNSIAEVLAMTQYSTIELAKSMKSQIDEAIKADIFKPTEGMKLLAEYEKGLTDQTYLTLNSNTI
jgi:arginine decarboxylase